MSRAIRRTADGAGPSAARLGNRRPNIMMALIATSVLVSASFAGAGNGQAATTAPTTTRPATPLITKTHLSHVVIPAVGGTTTLRISVRNAKTCWFVGMSGLKIPSAHQNCAKGTASATAEISPNDSVQLGHLHITAWAAGSVGAAGSAGAAGNAGAAVSVTVYFLQSGLNALVVTTKTLKTAQVAKRYSLQLDAKGGRGPYTWRLAAGELPVGLSLTPRGLLSGSPTIPGAFPISLQVSDASRPAPLSVSVQLILTIAPKHLLVTTEHLPGGVASSLYTASLAATGGVAPYSWELASGQLPPGLSLAPSGALSGTPTARGDFRFYVQVSDSAQPAQTVHAALSIKVTETYITDKTRSLPGCTTGSAVSITLVATGGIAPYTWAISSGELPSGVTLGSTGTLSGSATVAGTYKFRVKITDSSSIPQTLVVPYTLVVAAVPLAITTDKLPGASIQSPYSATLIATGGTGPYSWGIASGQLPPGITLSAAGALAGTPTQVGVFSVSVKVTDSSPRPQTATIAYKLIVAPQPLLVATTALPGATVHSPYVASLTASGGTSPFTWRIVSGHLPAGVTMTSAGNLAGVPKATPGTYPITVQVTDSSPIVQRTAAPLALVVGNNVVNWSGYVRSGLFTSVTGTFIVPGVSPGQDDIVPAAASEWVGLDGVTNAGFIRAGVTEVDPITGESYCRPASTGAGCIYPWWEVSPGATQPTPIIMTVNAGDSITVTIFQIKGDTWAITLADNTSGQNFRAEESYSGPGATAEDIVDAPASVPTTIAPAGSSGSTSTTPGKNMTEAIGALGAYSPAVPFTNLHTVGTAKSTAAVLLVQHGVQVSTPSVFTTAGFSVAYGSIVPPAP